MNAVRISTKFQVTIPRRIRDSMHLIPGQKMQVVGFGNRIEFVPIRTMVELRGFVKGIDTKSLREKDHARI
jgi:AbrB family looped-hinge helix DNA binding protein